MKPAGLQGRLMVAQLLVLLVAGVALAGVAALVAPPLFHEHLAQAGMNDPHVRAHTEEAFAQALGTALIAGAVAAVLAATVASVLVIRRVAAPVGRLVAAARDITAGRYGIDVRPSGTDTDFARLEEAFATMAGRLERTERARQQLLADLAHELRTPVATLVAYVDAVEDGVLPADATSWQVMRDQLDRLGRLVTDLSVLSAVDEDALTLEREEVDPAAVVAAAAAAAAPRFANKAVKLDVHSGRDLPVLSLDRHRIEQILANLLDNALRHTPEGGTVTASARVLDRHRVRISVKDTGEGIAPERLEAIFERFHRADSARSAAGSGLGLTIARGLATAHGGTLTATSAGPGQGTRFDLDLPVP